MIQSRLKSYSLSAGAATTLAVFNGAAADIASSEPGDIKIGLNAGATILFSLDGKNLRALNGTTTEGISSYLFTAGLFATGFDFNWAIVSEGVTVDSAFGFTGSEELIRSYYYYSTSDFGSSGDLALGTKNLLAFSLNNTETHYGWIEYSLAISSSSFEFTVHSWAYNDVAGEGIIAGQTTASGSSAVPGLGGLAALAIGAAGVRSRRQRTVA